MTMNPHTTATGLRTESKLASKAAATSAPARAAKRSFTPAALMSAAFILGVTLIAKAFYD